MATLGSDTLYANRTPPSFTIHQRAWVEERWKELEPWLAMEARRHLTVDPAAVLYEFKCAHRWRLFHLLEANIRRGVIRSMKLDDPTISDAAFEVSLGAAVKRRRARIGRVKGKGKKYTRKNKGAS